jgi:hypothetical protein
MRGQLTVDASIVIASCATVIAVASLAVSVYEARATRNHNRHSVRPILELRHGFPRGRTAGLQLTNSGIGPAAITHTSLKVDGVPLGEFNESGVNRLRDLLAIRPSATTLGRKSVLATDYDEYLLSIERCDPDTHREFADLIRHRLVSNA